MTATESSVAIVGTGIIGIASAYYLWKNHGIQDIVLIDQGQPLGFTSAQSGDNYRNWWPSTLMMNFTDRSIDLMEQLADETDNRFAMTRRGYILATRQPGMQPILDQLTACLGDKSDSRRPAEVSRLSEKVARCCRCPVALCPAMDSGRMDMACRRAARRDFGGDLVIGQPVNGMFRVKEILRIITGRGEASRQQREDDRVGVLTRSMAHFRYHRLEQPKLAVRKIVAADANGAFKLAVDDREAEGFQQFHLAFAREPFAHLRELAKPAIMSHSAIIGRALG